MRRLMMTSVFAAAGLLTGCYKIVPPGNVGIVVKQSGADRGVQDYPLKTGRVWYNPVNEVVLTYPTYVQRAIWTESTLEGRPVNDEISFQSAEGLRFTADVNASYELTRDQVPRFYVRFRNDDLETFTHGFFRDAVRNGFKLSTEYRAEDINGVKQAELIDRVLAQVRETMQPFGVNIIQLGFASPPRPPESVKQAIEAKIAATQHAERAENEKRQAIAEAAKSVEIARGQAQANDLLTKSLTPALVQWKQLEIRKAGGMASFLKSSGAGPCRCYRSASRSERNVKRKAAGVPGCLRIHPVRSFISVTTVFPQLRNVTFMI